jgi:hypothetical protein
MKESVHSPASEQSGKSMPPDSNSGMPPRLFPWLIDHPEGAAFWLTFLVAFSIYALTLPPHLTLGLAGTHVTGAWYAGVGHPPGYPVWTLYAFCFSSLFPVGNVAFRVALSSAVAMALASGLLAAAACRMCGHLSNKDNGQRRLGPIDAQRLKIVCSFAGASGFAFSSPVWKMAIAAEPDAFGVLLFCIACFLLQRWFFAPDRLGPLAGAVFVFGCAVVNSQWLFVAAPGLLLVVALRNAPLARDFALVTAFVLLAATLGEKLVRWVPEPLGNLSQLHNLWTIYLLAGIYAAVLCGVLTAGTQRLLDTKRQQLILFTAFLVPFFAYFYSAAASMTNPPVNWSYPRSLESFVHLIGRGQYEGVRPVDSFGEYLPQVGLLAPAFFKVYGWLFAIPALLCLLSMPRIAGEARTWLLALAGPFVCLTLLFLALLNPSFDRATLDMAMAFACPAYLLLTFWTVAGLLILGTRIGIGRQSKAG